MENNIKNKEDELILHALTTMVVKNGGKMTLTDDDLKLANDMGLAIAFSKNGLEMQCMSAFEIQKKIEAMSNKEVEAVLNDESNNIVPMPNRSNLN